MAKIFHWVTKNISGRVMWCYIYVLLAHRSHSLYLGGSEVSGDVPDVVPIMPVYSRTLARWSSLRPGQASLLWAESCWRRVEAVRSSSDRRSRRTDGSWCSQAVTAASDSWWDIGELADVLRLSARVWSQDQHEL